MLSSSLMLLMLPSLGSAAPVTINVWPKLAPGETTAEVGKDNGDHGGNILRLTGITCPTLTITRPEGEGARPAVMVCPGGGYGILAVDLEGTEVAEWLNREGYVAAVLHYRVPGKRDGALQDAQRAISTLRANAGAYGIDPKHIGVLGFSAGGHLSVRLACSEKRTYEPMDDIDKASCRPDFALPIYPAYLAGKDGRVAADVKPHAGMPPMFLVQTADDPFYCAPAYAKALEEVKVPVKLVVYEKGGHGYGLRAAADKPVHAWPAEAARWIKEQVGR